MRIIAMIIPIAGYFIAEQIFGAVGGLCAGAILLLLQCAIDYAKRKSIDRKMLYADFGIIALFALCEYLVENYAPDASTLVSAAVITLLLLFSLLPGKNIMAVMIERIMPGRMCNPFFASLMRQSLKRMLFWSVFATLFYIIAYIYPNTQLSEYIGDYLLLTVLMAYLASEFIMARWRKRKYKDTEWVQLVDTTGTPNGGAPRPKVHDGSKWLHAVVHMHVFNKRGELLLQLRPQSKKVQPGRWDTAVGGHIALGETLADALRRETREEIGLKDFRTQLTKKYIWKSEIENEYVFVFRTQDEGPFRPQNADEVDELMFWSREQIMEQMGKGVFTPNLEYEIKAGLLNA